MESYVRQLERSKAMIERSKTMARETARDRWNSKAWVRWSVGLSTPIIIGLAVWLFGLSTRVTAVELDTAVIVERQSGHKEQLDRMEQKLDKLVDREINQRRSGGGGQ